MQMVNDKQKLVLLALLVFLGALVRLVPLVNSFVGNNLLDEGWLIYNARRVYEGAVLYRDLFMVYWPGFPYALAFLYKLFGPNLLVARYFMVVDSAVTAVLLYLISSRLVGRYFALIPPFLYTIWTPAVGPTPTWVGFTVALMALLMALVYVEKGRLSALTISALSVAVALLVKQNIGAFALIFLVITVVWRERAACARPLLVMLGAIGAIILPVIVYFYAVGALGQLFFDTFVYELGSQSMGAIPPPSLFPISNMIISSDPAEDVLSSMGGFYSSRYLRCCISCESPRRQCTSAPPAFCRTLLVRCIPEVR